MRTDRFALVMLAACAVALCASARPVKAEGSLTVGDQWWSQTTPEAKFKEFRDVPRGPFLESMFIADWIGRNTYELSGKNIAQEDQALHGLWAWGSKLNVKIGWIETPHRFSFTTRSPFTEVQPGVFTLPDSFQALNRRVSSGSSIPNAFNDALRASRAFPLGFSTDVGTARVRARPKQGWMFEVNGRQTTRAGNKAFGTIIGTSPGNPMVELWEPIRQTITDADVRANYDHDRVTVQAIGGMSVFDNHLERMLWDNPRSLYDVPAVRGVNPPRDSIASVPGKGQLALAPDNQEVRGSVAVGVRLPKNSMFTGTVGVAQITQDQDWQPVTVNATLRPDTLDLPGTHTDGKATVINLDGRLTSRLAERVRGTLRFHSDKYDNKTPSWDFDRIVNGDIAQVGPVETRPFGNNNWVAGLEVDADPTTRVTVGASVELRTRERTHREIEKDKETVFGGRLKLRPADGLVFDAKGKIGNRELDAFHIEEYENEAGAFIEQPTTRRADVANRKQTQGSAGLSWAALEKVEVSANYIYLKNDYKDLEYGLTEDKSGVFASQATFHATSKLDIRGGYGFSQANTAQRSIQGLAATIATGPGRDSLAWTADVDDRNAFFTGGFDLWVTPDKLSFVADYEFSRDQVDFDLTAGYAFTSPFVSASNRFTGNVPSTFYRRQDVLFEARYQLTKSTQVTGRYGWEQFDLTDFAAENVPQVAAAAAALYLGDFYQDYRAHRVALLVKHSF